MLPFSFERVTAGNHLEPLNVAPTQDVEQRSAEESFHSHLRRSGPAESSSPEERADVPLGSQPTSETNDSASDERPSDGGTDTDTGTEEKSETEAASTDSDEQPSEGEQTTNPAEVAVPDEVLVAATELGTTDSPGDHENEVAADQEITDAAVEEIVNAKPGSQQLAAQAAESLGGTDEHNSAAVEKSEDRQPVDRKPSAQPIPDDAGTEGSGQSDSAELASTIAALQEGSKTNNAQGTDRGRETNRPDHQVNLQQIVETSLEQDPSQEDSNGSDASRGRRSRDDRPSLQLADGASAANGEATETTPQGRFAQHLMTRSQGETSKTLELNSAQQARFVDRVARAFHAAEGRGGTVRLRLHPPELGSLTLEVRVQGGALTARLEADTPLARTMLLDNLSVLRDRLAEQGIRIEQFDVDLLDRQAGHLHDGLEQREQSQDDDAPAQQPSNEESESAVGETSPRRQWETPDEQLDVTI